MPSHAKSWSVTRIEQQGAAAAYMQQPVHPPQLIGRSRLTKTTGHVLV